MSKDNARSSHRAPLVVMDSVAPISPGATSVRVVSNRDASYTGVYPGLDSVAASNRLIELVATPASEYSQEQLHDWITVQTAAPGQAEDI